MTETVDWPYDAPQDDPLTALRIPVVCFNPDWYYIVAFDKESAERPTDAETAMLVSYLGEYIDHWYGESYKAKLRQRPFDVDGGANGVVFHKYGPDDWAYRRRTWEYGPLFVPAYDRTDPLSLVQVMDRTHDIVDKLSPHWVAWKAAHPEVFGAVQEAQR